MKVCLVYPDIGGVEHYGARKFYHGLGYISSVLKGAGHETTLLYLQTEPTKEALLQQVAGLAPNVVAFSATTHHFPYVARFAQWIKEAMPAIWTVVGGAHPTLVPEDVTTVPGVDVACIGEGEYPMLDWVTALQEGKDVTHIPNLWVRQSVRYSAPRRRGSSRSGPADLAATCVRPASAGPASGTGGGAGWIHNPLRPLIANLDELPFADRELFGFEQILANNDGWVDLMAGRGCPYGCSYCCNPGLRDRFKGLGKYVRFRSVENVLSEIRSLTSHYRVKTLNFQDDVFTLDRDWTLQFCQAYGKQFDFPFWINTRVERMNDEEMVAALARAGCRGVRIGIESGNENLRAEILKRRMSNDEIRRAFALADKVGLKVYTCNMLGVPGETAAMIEETIALNRELEPADLQFSVFYPYPMTELYDLCVREGYLIEGESLPSYYERKSILHSPTLTTEELEEEYDRFQELKVELRMKKASPFRYRVYQVLRLLYGGDSTKARSALRFLGRIKMWLTGTPPRVGGAGAAG